MLYSLYFKQPCRPRARIRLVLAELDDLQVTLINITGSVTSSVG